MARLILDGTKLVWHLDRVKKWSKGERIAPITIEWALSRKCTYKCIFCNYDYTQDDRSIEREITKEAAFNFLEDAAEIGVKAVPLGCDGESTASPILYDVIPYAKKLGLDIALSTNGYLLKDERLGEILPHLTYLRFNICAGEPRRYAEIMGVDESCYHKVYQTIKRCIEIKKKHALKVTLGLQMVCMPAFEDQIIPMAKLGKELNVDYLVVKPCSDNHRCSIGVDYSQYERLVPIFKKAEEYSDEKYSVIPKWSKILSKGKRTYPYCFGPRFMLQISGSGLVACCGTFVHEKYSRFHVGNIIDNRFKDIVKSEKYWEVMNYIGSEKFDNSSCWSLCFQHKVNEFLWGVKTGEIDLNKCEEEKGLLPQHVNFV